MTSTKEHKRMYMREYRQKNLERLLAANRAYYWANREKMLAYGKKYREAQKAKMTEKELEEQRLYHRIMNKIYNEKKKESKQR